MDGQVSSTEKKVNILLCILFVRLELILLESIIFGARNEN